MLPDYPKFKDKLMEAFKEYMKRIELAHLGILTEMPETFIQEGCRATIYRSDGSLQSIARTTISVSENLKGDYKELEKLKQSDIYKLLKNLAIAQARAKTDRNLEIITQELEKVGNVVSMEAPAYEKLLSGLERIELDFVDGQPKFPSFAADPETTTRIEKALQFIFETPELNRRFESIIHLKREQYRDRETLRNMVE